MIEFIDLIFIIISSVPLFFIIRQDIKIIYIINILLLYHLFILSQQTYITEHSKYIKKYQGYQKNEHIIQSI